jgi:hypothetical protein
MLLKEQRRLIAPLFCHRPVTGRLIVGFTYLKIEQDRRLGWLKLVSTNWAVQLNVLQVAHEHN